MANVKITDLPSLTGANSASTDVLPVVDVSADTTSKMTRAEFFLNVPAVTTTGNVGVGIASPTSKLHVYDANTAISMNEVAAAGTGVASTRWKYSTNQFGLYVGTTNALVTYDYGAGAERMRISATGNLGVGTTAPAARVHVLSSSLAEQFRIQNVTTDATTKYGVVGGGHYTNAEEPFSGMLLSSTATTNKVDIGGGVSGMNAATSIVFSTASNNTTLIGTERLRIETGGQIGIGGANYGTSGQTIISAGSGAAPAWGTLPVAGGGTNITSYTIGDILFASASGILSPLADVATGNVIISGGVGAAPSYGKVGLTTHVSGTLPVANGGTGVTTAPAEAARILGYTATTTAAGTTVLTNTSTQYQLFSGSTTQTITLPVTSTLVAGWSFHIVNNSTGNLTVNSSGGNLVVTIIAGLSAMVTCIGTTLTTAADWEAGLTDFQAATGTGSVVLATSPAITGGSIDNMTVGATTAASVRGTSLVSTSVITDSFATRAAGTLALAMATNGVVQVTPNATGTFTSTVPAAGTRSTLIVLTSGTTSYTMTFGTGFKTTGTLATGTVSARYFVFQFISDGTSLIECSRTVAIA